MMITFGFKCGSCEEVDIKDILEPILPEEYDVLLISYEKIKRSNIVGESKASFRVNVDSEEGLETFMKSSECISESYYAFKETCKSRVSQN